MRQAASSGPAEQARTTGEKINEHDKFANGYWLTRKGMQWFWDQYTTDPAERALSTASPLRAGIVS